MKETSLRDNRSQARSLTMNADTIWSHEETGTQDLFIISWSFNLVLRKVHFIKWIYLHVTFVPQIKRRSQK